MPMRTNLLIAGLMVSNTISIPLSAHHAFSAEFDASKPIVLTGKVVKIDWRNPHAQFLLAVGSSPGSFMDWELELPSPNVLIRQGWSRESFRQGETLTVSGYRARDTSRLASVRTIRFADGRTIVIGAASDGGPGK
jgi:hypothetical protein